MDKPIEFESTSGTAVTPPRQVSVSWDTPARSVPLAAIRQAMSSISHEGRRGFAPAIQMEAEINGTTFAATAYRDGGVDLNQPRAGMARRRKKMLYIDSVDDLMLFLQNVQGRAREYYGPGWGKEGQG